MTVKDYISQKLEAFNLTDADYATAIASSEVSLDDEVTVNNIVEADKMLVHLIEWKVFQPKRSNVSEGGFSVSWEYGDLGKFYLWLCKKCGITPNDDVLSMLGTSMITDATDRW